MSPIPTIDKWFPMHTGEWERRWHLELDQVNDMMINFPHCIWNYRAGVGNKGPGFEVIWWRLDVQISWRLIWFFTMKGVELINLSSKTWREEFIVLDNSCISLVFNTSTEFTNILLSHAKICKNWLGICCFIADGIWRTKMSRALIWSGQCCWISKYL